MKSIAILLVTLTFTLVKAQQPNFTCPVDGDYEMWLQTGLMGFEYHNPVEGYKGKQYFNSWVLGEVMLQNGDVVTNIYLQYDQYQDQLLWLRKSDFKAGVLNKDAVVGFRLPDSRNGSVAEFARRNTVVPYLGLSMVFLQVLEPGELTLYAYRNSKVMSGDNRLIDYTRYMISADGKDYWIKLQRKNLLDIRGIDKAAMKDILRANRITVSGHEAEFTRSVHLYNSARKSR